ncbi:MAG TPA: UDP-N-acetyl glucosamine 2-epimerase, partial [Candidatus Latescibacteria bacterium]|nr:UDP-N-acetyl glucosamine 2-epimerase [Candidatus Latescibacterota bacterium]
MKNILVAGARPNFMKIAPIVHELRRRYGAAGSAQPADGAEAEAMAKAGADVSWRVVHTGQHYDYEMSRTFFEELELDEPDHFLNVGSASHAEQAARVMAAFEPVCLAEQPDRVVVVGDVNSTMACALVAVKLGIPVTHVEAGLRSFDRAMPEEINRLVTDAVADLLLVSEPSGLANLEREGRARHARFVGNVMIDALHFGLRQLEGRDLTAHPAPRAVVTLHRPSNVDEPGQLGALLDALAEVGRDMPVFFPIHPRTRKNIDAFGLAARLAGADVRLLPPLPYLEFLHLWRGAALVLTDSGGIQE